MMAGAASLARAKENPNALPDRIELLLDDNYATRMASVSPRPSPNPSPGPSPSSSASASASPSPNSNPGQLCGRSTLDDVPPAAAATGRQPLGDSFGLDGRVGAPLFRLSTPCPPLHLQASRHRWSPSRPTIAPHHLPPRAHPRSQPHVSVDLGVGLCADVDVDAPGACGAGPAHLRCAMRHLLCKYRFVGMTSRLSESACVLNSLFGWTQRPVPHSHETNSRADRVPHSAPSPAPAPAPAPAGSSPDPGPGAGPSPRPQAPGPKPQPKPRSNPPQVPPDFMKYHAGLVQYDEQLFALAAALFEEHLDRFPTCRAKGVPRPNPLTTRAARNGALRAVGIPLSEMAACGWQR